MKIGIYTIHACNNFGALLQAYATAKFLNDNGFEAELVNLVTTSDKTGMNYRHPWNNLKYAVYNLYAMANPAVRRKISRYQKFRAMLPLSKPYFTNEEVIDNQPQYDIHLVGSDQVWNVESGKTNPYFFLSFLSQKAVRISYASSFGNVEVARKIRNEIIQPLSLFRFRSVREQDAADFLTQECNLPTECVLDPTFLLSASQWSTLVNDAPLINGNYILYYGFDNSRFCADILAFLRKLLGIPVIGVSVSIHSPYFFDRFCQDAGPIEFLNLIKNASFVITSSFHGMALSLNFRKDFAVISHGSRMSRIESLLKKFHISSRIINDFEGIKKLVENNQRIDYQAIELEISSEIDKSKSWLLSSIKNTL